VNKVVDATFSLFVDFSSYFQAGNLRESAGKRSVNLNKEAKDFLGIWQSHNFSAYVAKTLGGSSLSFLLMREISSHHRRRSRCSEFISSF
jgi:hypothetical protein